MAAIMEADIKALEFFCGIGGLRYALASCYPSATIVASFDINPTSNTCYQHNFKEKPIQLGIDHLSADQIDSYSANCWLLSPPCQPYTKCKQKYSFNLSSVQTSKHNRFFFSAGKQLHSTDPRASALHNLISLLPNLKSLPTYIFLENVLNFEHSDSRSLLISTLHKLGYSYKEWLLTPLQFGIPNDRLRYYLTAKKRDSVAVDDNVPAQNLISTWIYPVPEISPISQFLDPLITDYSKWKIPTKFVKSRTRFGGYVIVLPSHTRTCCFTKAYGHHGVGSGSFLVSDESRILPEDDLMNVEGDIEDFVERLCVRFFTPIEIARLQAFPTELTSTPNFSFPDSLTVKQQWRLLGNSVNVKVCWELMKHELFAIEATK
ncbi:C-5 cytosine-specific DNA methylase [Nowakowskiella sp. JEL0407]|nr:C-5 cytosine-specific DNA methylase [Nowakowskiella sp. JEL0407]